MFISRRRNYKKMIVSQIKFKMKPEFQQIFAKKQKKIQHYEV